MSTSLPASPYRFLSVARRPDAYVANLVASVASEGQLDRVVLGQDLARRHYWRAYGGGPGLVNLVAAFPRRLREAGLTDAPAEQLSRHHAADLGQMCVV